MRKKIAYVLVALCLVAAFAGCGGGAASETPSRRPAGGAANPSTSATVEPVQPFSLVAVPTSTTADGIYIVDGNVLLADGEVLMEGNFSAVYDNATGELRYLVDMDITPQDGMYVPDKYESTVYTPDGQFLLTRDGAAGTAYGLWLSFVQSSSQMELDLSDDGSFIYLYNMETGETLFEGFSIYYDESYGIVKTNTVPGGPAIGGGILWEDGRLLWGDWPAELGYEVFPYGEGYVIGDNQTGYTWVDKNFQPVLDLRAKNASLADGVLLLGMEDNTYRLYDKDGGLVALYDVAGIMPGSIFHGANAVLRIGSERALFAAGEATPLSGWYLDMAKMQTADGSTRYYARDEDGVYILDADGSVLYSYAIPAGFASSGNYPSLAQWNLSRLALRTQERVILLDEQLNPVCDLDGFSLQALTRRNENSPYFFRLTNGDETSLFDMNGQLLVSGASRIYYADGGRIVLQQGNMRGMMDLDGNWIYTVAMADAPDD